MGMGWWGLRVGGYGSSGDPERRMDGWVFGGGVQE